MKRSERAADRRSPEVDHTLQTPYSEFPQTDNRAARHGGDTYWIADVAPWRLALDHTFLRTAERTGRWVLRHWLLLANLSNAATVAGAVLAPWLMVRGWVGAGRALFAAYSLICAQNPAHSYFFFGYQMAIDQRMLAIYISATVAGLIYALLRRQLPALPWRLYLVLIAPLAIDGFTQLFGWRHSNWELRTVTGGIFGTASVWWLYPFLEREIARLRRVLAQPSCSQYESTTRVVQV